MEFQKNISVSMMHAFGYFCILYRKRFSIYSDCTFLHSSKGLITHFFHLHMLSFVFVNKQIKTPQKNKKLNIREMYINLKGEKIIFPNREKDRWKRKKMYLGVLRLRSWSVCMRSFKPWWTVRQSRECGDEAAAATTRVWIVDGMSVSEGLRLETRETWDWE